MAGATRPASLSQSTRETNTRTAARISKDHGIPAETALRDTARKRAKPEGDRMAVGE